MFNQFLLLAERNPFRDMASVVRERREHFDPSELLPWLFVLAALFGALAIVSRYLNRQDKRRIFNNPRALFRALCRAHELDRSACGLMHQLAKANFLEEPAALFLDPELFEAARLAPEFRRHQTAIESLIAKLFANEPPLTRPAETRAPAQETPPISTDGSGGRLAQTSAAAPPTKLPGRPRRGTEPGAANEGSLSEQSKEAGPSLAEQQAVRALETLMKQINASREAASTAPADTRTGAAAGRFRAERDEPRPPAAPDVAAPVGDQFARQ
jgi:hypothetical protein